VVLIGLVIAWARVRLSIVPTTIGGGGSRIISGVAWIRSRSRSESGSFVAVGGAQTHRRVVVGFYTIPATFICSRVAKVISTCTSTCTSTSMHATVTTAMCVATGASVSVTVGGLTIPGVLVRLS